MILWKYFCRGKILIATPMCSSLYVYRALKNTNYDVTSRSCVFLRGREIVPSRNIKCNSVFLQIFIKWREAECMCAVRAGTLEYASLPKIKSVTCCDVYVIWKISRKKISNTQVKLLAAKRSSRMTARYITKKSRLYNC